MNLFKKMARLKSKKAISVLNMCVSHMTGNIRFWMIFPFRLTRVKPFAFVGHTGSGKSSIINVLMRFYEFQSGRVLLDDVDIRDYSQEELRKTSVWSCRNPSSIMEPLSPISPCTKTLVMSRSRLLQPSWMQIPLFKTFLRVTTHLCPSVVRAFQLDSASFLPLLEQLPVSPKSWFWMKRQNIDSETESLVQASLAKMRRGRTTIAIAHRLSTIQDANCIYVLDKGRIIESGSHEELWPWEEPITRCIVCR